MDYSIYKAIDGTGPHFLHAPLKFAANDLVFVIVAIVALTFLIPWRSRRIDRRTGAVMATAAGGLALLLVLPISNAVDRTRPFVTHPHAHLLISHGRDPGFPSDHATGAFAMAMGLWLYDRTIGAVAFMHALDVCSRAPLPVALAGAQALEHLFMRAERHVCQAAPHADARNAELREPGEVRHSRHEQHVHRRELARELLYLALLPDGDRE